MSKTTSILVVNAGSSSLKCQLFDSKFHMLAKILVDQIGFPDSGITFSYKKDTLNKKSKIANHQYALKLFLDMLIDTKIIKSLNEIVVVGHRVVHGGDKFLSPVIISSKIKKDLNSYVNLAPLHMPANIAGIEACQKYLDNATNVAVFDTSFHQSIDPAQYLYDLPSKFYTKYKIRKYGFHGISHQYVYEQAKKLLKLKKNHKLITCHIGNGASMTAIDSGRVVDTSMGFTPLQGLMMGTRSGDIDPGVIIYLIQHLNMDINEVDQLLNKQSGLMGITGKFSDMRDIRAGYQKKDKNCILAMDMYIYSIEKYIGAYVAALGGVDTIVLTAGVLENSSLIRKLLLDKLGWLGIKLDSKKNQIVGSTQVISTTSSKVKVIVIPTNEELSIAKQSKKLLG